MTAISTATFDGEMGKSELETLIASLDGAIRSLDRWVLIFGAFVAIGVVGETVIGLRHWILDGRLRAARHSIVGSSPLGLNQLRPLPDIRQDLVPSLRGDPA